MRLFILVVALLVPTFASSAEKITPGRYELASYSTGARETSLILVDTATGKTWFAILDENIQWRPVTVSDPISDADSGQSSDK